MRARIAWIVWIAGLLVILLSSPAVAQINPFTTIIAYEDPSLNPSAKNPTSTASGLFQNLNGTWATALSLCGAACGTTAQFPTMGSAPVNVQFAAEAALLNAHGFADYTCAGCNPQLAAAIQAAGGPAAFDLSNLSTDPATYANLNDPSALQSYYSLNGGSATLGDGTTLTGDLSPLAPPQAAVPVTIHVFEWAGTTILAGIRQQVDTQIATAQAMVWPLLMPLLIIAVALMAIRTMVLQASAADFVRFTLVAAFVLAFMSPGTGYYSLYVEGPALAIPDTFAQAFAPIGTTTLSVPATFDAIIEILLNASLAIIHEAPWYDKIWLGFVLLGCCTAGTGVFLALIFFLYLGAQYAVYAILIIGPLVIPAMLFASVRDWVSGYARVLGELLLQIGLMDLSVVIFGSLILAFVKSFPVSGSPHTDLSGLVTVPIAVLIALGSMTFLMTAAHRIVGGAGHSFVPRGQPGRGAAGLATAGAAGAAGAAALAATAAGGGAGAASFARAAFGVAGRSLSRAM